MQSIHIQIRPQWTNPNIYINLQLYHGGTTFYTLLWKNSAPYKCWV